MNRKVFALLALISALGPIASNIYLPALPVAQADFGVGLGAIQLTLTLGIAGYALGLLLWGNVSDRIGRRPALLLGTSTTVIGATACALSYSVATLAAARVVQAIGTSSGMIVTRSIVVERFPVERQARALATIAMFGLLGHVLAPVVGSWLARPQSWRWSFAIVAIVATLLLLAALRWLPKAPAASATAHHDRHRGQRWAAVRTLLATPPFVRPTIQLVASYVSFAIFTALAPHVVTDAFGLPATSYGVWYLVTAAGLVIGYGLVRFAPDLHLSVAGRPLSLWIAAGAGVAGPLLSLAGAPQPLATMLPPAVICAGHAAAMPQVQVDAMKHATGGVGTAWSVITFAQFSIGAGVIQLMSAIPADSPYPMQVACGLGAIVVLMASRREAPPHHA